MKKIILCLVVLCLTLQFTSASTPNEGSKTWSGKNIKKIEKIDEKRDNIKKKKLELKVKENKIKKKIKSKLEKKLLKFDNLPDEKKSKLYDEILKTINSILEEKWISKTNKVLYTLIKEIILERKNLLNK